MSVSPGDGARVGERDEVRVHALRSAAVATARAAVAGSADAGGFAPVPTLGRVHVLGQVRATAPASCDARALTSLPANLVLALVLAPGRSLSTGSLVVEVWGEQPPGGARAALQTLVSRTRRRHLPGMILSTAGGYALRLDDCGTDLDQAQALAARGRAALGAGDVASADGWATQGLALWTGEPGAGATNESLVDELARRAALVRDDLQQILAEAYLGSGRYPEAVRLLEVLRAGSPFSDPLCLLHLTALAAAGRSNEAVDEFARFRLSLAESLGTDPSRELSELHGSLLRQDAVVTTAPRVLVGVRRGVSSLVGRDTEVDEVLGRLTTQRLVTILGMGGVGKTRLAQEVAARASASFPAVYVVELAAARTDVEVGLSIASALGVRGADGPGSPDETLPRVLGQVAAVLADRPALLVLDNLEQVAAPAALVVASLLSGTPSTRVLATTRAALGLAGEHVLDLAPLSTVAADDEPEPAAVRLFSDRARAVRPDVHLPSDVVVRLCERLDGLPLAIELAAARVRSMPVGDIEGRLGDRFALLTSADRSVPARHRTLHDVIAWSWELLDADQQLVCRRVAFFPDGFTTQAAASVVDPEGDGSASVALLDALDALVAQSFVRLEEDPEAGTSRLRMLETVREFCQQKAGAAGEVETVRSAAFGWARRTCAADLAQLHGPAQELTFRRLVVERENLMSILREAISDDEPDTVACVFAVTALWQVHRGAYLEGVTLGPAVQDALRGRSPQGRWATVHLWSHLFIGLSQLVFGDVRRSARARLDVLRAADAADGADPLAAAAAQVLRSIGDMAEVDRLLADASTSLDPTTRLFALVFLAVRAEDHGDIDAAFACATAAHGAAVEAQDLWVQASSSATLARLHRQSRQPKDALWWGAKAASGFASLGIDPGGRSVPTALDQLADGQLEAAERTFRAALEADPTAEHRLVATAGLAEVHLASGRTDDGLAEMRELAESLVWSATDVIMPNLLVASTCVVAHALDGSDGPGRWLADVMASLRALVLQVDEATPEHMDRPVLGAVAVARAAWASIADDPRPGTSGATQVVDLLALAERLHSRQDLPHLSCEPVWQAVARWLTGADDSAAWAQTRADALHAARDLSLADSARQVLRILERLG